MADRLIAAVEVMTIEAQRSATNPPSARGPSASIRRSRPQGGPFHTTHLGIRVKSATSVRLRLRCDPSARTRQMLRQSSPQEEQQVEGNEEERDDDKDGGDENDGEPEMNDDGVWTMTSSACPS